MNYGKKGTRKKEKQLTSKGTMVRKKFTVIFCKTLLICMFAVVIIGGCAGIGVYKGIIDSAPDIKDIDATPTGYLSTVLDTDGNETASLVASGSNRKSVTLDEIPINLQHAFVAIEDSRFYTHNGIDIQGIIRAGITGITSGEFSQGASTITQQLLKNNVFTDWVYESSKFDRIERKLQEQYLAIQLEKVQDKDWILVNYLNTINLGQNTLGVQAASLRYFNKDVSELNLSECAVIAAITQNPSKYNPVSNPDENAKRRKKVLDDMKDQGYINQSEYDEAMDDDVYDRIQLVNTEIADDEVNSYFVDALTDQIIQDLIDIKGYTETQAYYALYNGGLTIYSTQDSSLQAIADEEVNNLDNYSGATPECSFSYRLTIKQKDGTIKNYSEQTMLSFYRQTNSSYDINFASEEEAQAAIDQYKLDIMEDGDTIVENGESTTFTLQPQASLTLIDQSTGEVKAIVGGRGEKLASKTLNRATDTTRQPGSTFKILAAYAPALDSGGMTLATVQDDAPYSYENGTSLRNYDSNYRGFTTLRQAITNSINVVTVKTLTAIGTDMGYNYLLNFGFSTLVPEDNIQSLALGGITKGVTNLELTDAYATIANGGTYTAPRFYTKILDHEGNVLIDNTPQTHTVLKSSTAWLLTSAMEDVVTSGTGTAVNFGTMPIAGKTGTTTKNRDALFAGFTPYYTCVVWGGYDDNSQLSSTAYPKQIWRSVMTRVHEGLEYKDFTMPEDITTATVCKKSGKLAVGGLCDADPRGSQVETEYFAVGTVPTEVCDHHVSATICTASGLLANEYCPAENKQTSVYIVGGSADSGDGPYLLSDALANSTCNVHNASTANPKPSESTSNSKDKDKDKNKDKDKTDSSDKSDSSDKADSSDKTDDSDKADTPSDNSGDTAE